MKKVTLEYIGKHMPKGLYEVPQSEAKAYISQPDWRRPKEEREKKNDGRGEQQLS